MGWGEVSADGESEMRLLLLVEDVRSMMNRFALGRMFVAQRA